MLVKDGPGEITAGDIDLPAAVEVIDPGAYIGTVEDAGRLEMRLTIRRGRGYVSADDNKRPGTALGVIPIDSIFSPVTRVAYHVGSARVGQRTDYDKLTLEVETNGAMEPDAALFKAAALLRDDDLEAIFLADIEDGSVEAVSEPTEGPESEDDMAIDDLDLGVRSTELSEARRDRDRWRSRREVGARAHVHPEFRSQEPRRGARASREEQSEA